MNASESANGSQESIETLENLQVWDGNIMTFASEEVILPTTRSASGTEQCYRDASLVIFESSEDAAKFYQTMSARAGGDIGESADDSYSNTTLNSRIYYSRLTIDDMPYLKFTKATGSITTHSGTASGSGASVGGGVAISGSSVLMGINGYYSGGFQMESQEYNLGIVRSWTKTPPSSWIPVTDTAGTLFGCEYTVSYVVNGNTWDASVKNQYVY